MAKRKRNTGDRMIWIVLLLVGLSIFIVRPGGISLQAIVGSGEVIGEELCLDCVIDPLLFDQTYEDISVNFWHKCQQSPAVDKYIFYLDGTYAIRGIEKELTSTGGILFGTMHPELRELA